MTIGEQTIEWYKQNDEDFAAALLRCFLFGLVVKRPELVVLAEEVQTDGERIVAVAPDCQPNCWFVHFAAAPTGKATPYDFMAEAPYPLEFVAFKKRGKTKVYTWSEMRKDVHGRIAVSTSSETA